MLNAERRTPAHKLCAVPPEQPRDLSKAFRVKRSAFGLSRFAFCVLR